MIDKNEELLALRLDNYALSIVRLMQADRKDITKALVGVSSASRDLAKSLTQLAEQNQ